MKLGHRDSLTAEILTGIEAGTPAIVNPSDDVADGTRVARSKTELAGGSVPRASKPFDGEDGGQKKNRGAAEKRRGRADPT